MALLCATNFSVEAIAATTVAAQLAKRRGEPLWLVYVMPPQLSRAFGDQFVATADATLKGEAARARKLGATVTPAMLIGKLHQALPTFVAENKIELVIAGDVAKQPSANGSGALARLGMTLEAPLWVVREPERILAWAREERPLRVMVGLDQTQSATVAVRWLEQLKRFGEVEVIGGHIYFPAAEYHRLGLPLPRGWNDEHPELISALHRELGAKLPGCRVRLEPAIGRVSDHLSALAADEQVDLLLLGTHHRRAIGRLWSVSEQCLSSAPMSVVCVPRSNDVPFSAHALPTVERVLIATDFSPTADRAVAWGLGILSAGGTADLVHVSAQAVTAADERAIIERLLARVPTEASARNFTIRGHALVDPSPAHAITAAAERFTSSAICLGSRADASVAKAIFGSTARAVLEGSNRPVFIVRPPEP